MSKTKQVLELSSPSMKTKHERLTGLVQLLLWERMVLES